MAKSKKMIRLCLWVTFLGVALPICAVHGQQDPLTTTRQYRSEPVKLLTVCEAWANLNQYAGQPIAVVGRLSRNAMDGGWLSQNGCGTKVRTGDANFPFALQIICITGSNPPIPWPDFHFDPVTLKTKLKQLRKSTRLEYYDDFTLPRAGTNEQSKKIRRKETWMAVYGRIKPAQGHGMQAFLCSGNGASLNIEDPDLGRPSR